MLSPAQKNLSEEDSSESDTGSVVEPETDRFGFILTSRSTAGSVGPAPELVRQREAKWIDILAQWDRILLKKTSKVKVQCQKGIPASLRARCWPLLCGAADRIKKNENLYKSLDSQPALQSWVDVIERDLDRQFPFHEMFLSKDGHGQRGLFEVLKAYTQYKPNEGYCQAQGPVAAVLLMNMPAEEAFWCLVQISEQYLPGYYSPLLEGVLFDAALLMWVLKRTCPAAHRHLQHHGVEPLMFATDWLMCLFTRHLPFNMVLRVWDLFFCYGVRVLLQVAVVLVRRVLGRAEQRKQCQGQLETLERLRSVKEQVQEEDDAFIAEVCSVPLSAKDLEKKTEKEVEKWRKDRPSSTFDPRSRCLGYQMAWATTLQNHEEEEKEKIEKGNLSVPLSRSSSTLSLSPFMSNNKRRKWGKSNAGEWESSGKLMRHLSMGAKEDSRNWREANSKTVQKEDVVLREYIKQSESQLTAHIKQKEAKCMDTIKNITTEQVGQNVKEQSGKEETSIADMEQRQCQAPEEPVVSEQTRETNVKTEPTQDPAKDQTLEDSLQSTECTTQCEQELDSDSQSQVLEEQKCNNNNGEIEAEDQSRETEKQMVESAVEEAQTEVQKNDDAETNTEVEMEANVQQTEGEAVTEECTTQCQQELDSDSQLQVLEEQKCNKDGEIEAEDQSRETEKQMLETAVEEAQTEVQKNDNADTNTEAETEANVQQTEGEAGTEISDGPTEISRSDTEGDVNIPSVKNPTIETETGQQEITEHNLQYVFEGKYSSTETLTETHMEKEPHAQNVTDTAELTQDEKKEEKNTVTQDVQEDETLQRDTEEDIDSKREAVTLLLHCPECNQPNEGTDLAAETEAEIPVSDDAVSDSSQAFAPCSEVRCDAESEPTQEEKDEILTENTEQEQTQAEETQTEIREETSDNVEPQLTEMTSHDGESNITTEPEGKMSSEDARSPEEPVSDENLATVCANEKSQECVQENTVEEKDVLTSVEPTDSNAESHPNVQSEESLLMKEQAELRNTLTQASSRHNSRSSGDFCIRRSSTSRGCRMGQRLSEDLFTVPQKTSQSQSITYQTGVNNNESEAKSVSTQAHPDLAQTQKADSSLSEDVAGRVETQQETPGPPKRFGLFSRLKGEQPKRNKTKGKPKMQVPKILIQDFSDGVPGIEIPAEVDSEEKLSSRERRRRRREQERKQKEEERLRKKREKELEKVMQQEKRKMQTRGKSLQVQTEEKRSSDDPQPAKTGSQTNSFVASYAESYF